MRSKIDFEKSLRFTKITLLCSGIKVMSKGSVLATRCLDFIFYFNFIWLYTDVLAEFYWLIEGIHLGKSFSELTLTAPCIAICILATSKCTPLYYNRDLLVKVFDALRNMHPRQRAAVENLNGFDAIHPENDFSQSNHFQNEEKSMRFEMKIVKDAVRLLNSVMLLYFTSCVVVVVAFTMLPLMAMAYEYYEEGQVRLQLPFLVKYFFDPFTPIIWPVMYFHQVWSTFLVSVNVFSADTSLYVFCTYIHMHFRILCHRIENVVSKSEEETRKRLMDIAKTHQGLIHLVNDIELIYSKSTLFNILTSSLLICLSAFNVTFLDDIGAVFAFLTFLVMCTSQIFLLCFFGNMLMRSSIKVSEAVYKSRWYDTDPTTKKIMLLILMRAQKPCKLTAAKFADLNLSAFNGILSRSWSYFALLKTMYK